MFTQLNQYRVVLEVKPEYWQDRPTRSRTSTCSSARGAAGPALRLRH